MSVERIVLTTLLWSLVLAGLYLLRKRSPFHLPSLALIVTGLVGSFFPVASSFVEPSSWRNLDYLSPELIAATQVEYVAYAAGLLLAVFAAAHFGWLERGEERAGADHELRDLVMSAGLVVSGAALYFVYVRRVGMSALVDRDDYAYKYLLGRGLGPLQFGLSMAIAGCLWAEASSLSRSIKNLFVALGAGIVIWSFAFISVRTNAVLLTLGYLTVLAWRRRFELRRVRFSLAVLLIALYALLESFALFRGVYRGDLAEAVWILRNQGERAFAGAVGGSELSHPFVTAAEVLRAREAGELAGGSLIDGLLACLPRGLYPERPLVLSEQFVRSNYAELAARGGGTAFSLVAESWLDFGSLLGPLAFGLALGLVCAWVERRRERVPAGLVARTMPYFAFYVAMQHRNEFATLVKQVFMLSLAVLPLWILAETISVAFARRAAPVEA